MRVLALVTDAFGGRGGIALYNRDLLTALCGHPDCVEVIAVPRLIVQSPEPLPDGLTYPVSAARGKIAYAAHLLRAACRGRHQLLICGHIHLLPLALVLKRALKIPLLLEIYGIEAWQPRNALIRRLVNGIDSYLSISELTRDRFLAWSGLKPEQGSILPNAVHLDRYGTGIRNPRLMQRYGLEGRDVVLMTMGRLSTAERYKGFDEMLELLPSLNRRLDRVKYLIVGDGDDRARLQARACQLGLAGQVVFTGYITEAEKAEHLRLADVFIMPSRGEGFGFVFLEAMACGVPVIASRIDGGREALRDGALGRLVDPADPGSLITAIDDALTQPRGVPSGLDYFSFGNFRQRLWTVIDRVRTRGRIE